jgi:hypothetical protein
VQGAHARTDSEKDSEIFFWKGLPAAVHFAGRLHPASVSFLEKRMRAIDPEWTSYVSSNPGAGAMVEGGTPLPTTEWDAVSRWKRN